MLGGSCEGGLCDALLAAGALDGEGGGVALAAGLTLAVTLGWLQVAPGAAQEMLPQIME